MGGYVSHNMGAYEVVKRGIDIIGALIGLFILSPLFVLVAILIKLENPRGSVFFYQTRIGKDEKPFRMYKFRSMVTDAEKQLESLLVHNEIKGAMFKMKRDPRVTRVGRFIRKTSIDELPQLVNVIKGDMSLVGPRPPLVREVEAYNAYHKQRLSVTPGCTGLWQVCGRNELSFEQMVELDLMYISRRSLWLDFRIILKTIRVMIIPNSSY
ncbi:sugar transferase [Paenibacillus xylaniclasticus]|uniref:sugar transferase n=1 Tax=Paenibacillus xylaniclasticus TaxID=588083 RepID=UPI001FE502EF|nr:MULTISPECIES: sugar transferase [Paenibacillus]